MELLEALLCADMKIKERKHFIEPCIKYHFMYISTLYVCDEYLCWLFRQKTVVS